MSRDILNSIHSKYTLYDKTSPNSHNFADLTTNFNIIRRSIVEAKKGYTIKITYTFFQTIYVQHGTQ